MSAANNTRIISYYDTFVNFTRGTWASRIPVEVLLFTRVGAEIIVNRRCVARIGQIPSDLLALGQHIEAV